MALRYVVVVVVVSAMRYVCVHAITHATTLLYLGFFGQT